MPPIRPPYRVFRGGRKWIEFDYELICLQELDAAYYVEHQLIQMYTMLPAMQNSTPPVLLQAVREMVQYYPRAELKHHLIRFDVMFSRSKTISAHDRQQVIEELQMQKGYDWFINENPKVIERVKKAQKEAEMKGEAKGKLETKPSSVLRIITLRFPDLQVQAQQKVNQITDLDRLDQLLDQVTLASNARHVRQILGIPVD